VTSSGGNRLALGAAAGAVAAAAVVGARAFFKQTGRGNRRLLDWDSVCATAGERSGTRGRMTPARRARQTDRYQEWAAELAPLLGEVCPDVPFPVPPVSAIDRPGFIDANIRIAQRVLEPVEKLRATLPESAATALGRRVMDRYVGELFGLMSRRVLGQFDPVLAFGPSDDTPQLFMVEPNLDDVQRSQKLDADELRRWILLHELTHAWQFSQHPWLREHITGAMQRMISETITRDGTSFVQSRDLLQRLPELVRSQIRTVMALQALMSVLEGYSNFVMHRVGEQHIQHAAELQAALQRRRRERTAIERLVLTITGLDMKMRQYDVGERFCSAVADRAGIDALNRVWESAEMMPSNAELKRPGDWIARTANT
jgi:coenzyme F420 biosynthesis associated uncharacterized protein